MQPQNLDGTPAPPGTPDMQKVDALIPLLQTLLSTLESHASYQTPLPENADSLSRSLFFVHGFAKRTLDIFTSMRMGMNRAAEFMHYYTKRAVQMGNSDNLPRRPPPGFSRADAEVDEVIMNETEFDPRITMAMAQLSGMRLIFQQEIAGYLKEQDLKSMHKIYKEGMGRCQLLAVICQDGGKLGQMAGVEGEVDLGEDVRGPAAAVVAIEI
ncbi:hypothetical protein TWF694_005528 [Orbilia ellipsospora]|uniref:Uncharacterized protein n=1 Tax=Orbilia ellipsospora TaxID=2528407 RepID=A0AAV9WTC4_9PEZI